MNTKLLQKNDLIRGDIMNHRKAPRFDIVLRRFEASIRVPSLEKDLPSRIFLVDISVDGVGMFSPQFITPGTPVSVTLRGKATRQLTIAGVIAWCFKIRDHSRVIKERTYPYRIGIQFHQLNQNSQQILKDFLTDTLNGR